MGHGVHSQQSDDARQHSVHARRQRVRRRLPVSLWLQCDRDGSRGADLFARLKDSGSMETYAVGGAVRDELLGLTVKDRDWGVVGATPQEMLAQGFVPVGRDFPVFLHPRTHEEYALARTERKTAPGYTGFAFHAAPGVTLEQDLIRRDLTINAMAKDAAGAIIDPHGGRADLAARVLRHVSPAL